MSSSCQGLLDALKDCLKHSDCVMKQGNLPSDCLKNHMEELPEECRSLRKATFECKRGMLDMRKRQTSFPIKVRVGVVNTYRKKDDSAKYS
ncbi:cytochrome c oxidase assembly protein [Lentinula edodes]|uniref:Cytochrome c oxidase assembly protein n=1 Tax=Lentinula edodes TaxID=5353 RepID=A0A1Q3EKB3_LENED|nr:cytochrome c oxidase assembly protein [Lentinula edodes]